MNEGKDETMGHYAEAMSNLPAGILVEMVVCDSEHMSRWALDTVSEGIMKLKALVEAEWGRGPMQTSN